MRKYKLWRFRLAVVLGAFLVIVFPVAGMAGAAGTNQPIQYNTVMTRYYRSSVDGAVLPASVYVPQRSTKMPVWVDLHAFGGMGGISEKMAACAQSNGCIIISPWGRNYHSFYADGRDMSSSPEPRIVDDFTNNAATGWNSLIGDQWKALGDTYQQLDSSDSWKLSSRTGSTGSFCTASADIKMLESSDGDGNSECAAGLVVRRQGNGGCYLVDLDRDSSNRKWVRIFRFSDFQWTTLSTTRLPDTFDVSATHNLKVVMFEDNLEVHVDYILAAGAQDSTFTSGEVALASFGAKHQFDNVRIQDESLYGERDILDTIDQCLEELNPVQGQGAGIADSSRVFLSGQSMGGLGAWNLGLHYPDLFSFIHPAYGSTDLIQGYNWIKAQYPDQDPSQPVNGQYFAREQDSNIDEAIRAMNSGTEPGTSTLTNSDFHESSARYILENALNTPVRLEHAEYDTIVPNTKNPLTIKWLTAAGQWIKVKEGSQRPSSSYANSQSIWQTWSNTPGLTGCTPETSLYDAATGNPGPLVPTLGIWNNTDYSAMDGYNYGAHCAVESDASLADPIFQSFLRLNTRYGRNHTDPDDVAYKTYDTRHNRAWWLTVEAAYPGQDRPGLARVHRDKAGNAIAIHVKNLKSTIIDVKRMGLSTASGKLTVSLDSNTAPESEFKVQDDYRKTDLKLVGEWFPAEKGDYQVTLDGNPVSFEVTGTTLTVANVDTSSARTLAITAPAGLDGMNILAGANPGFESGMTGWAPAMDGGINGILELNQDPSLSHTGTNSIRIKDPKANVAPFMSYWQSNPVTVSVGKTYTLDAFARTRALNSVVRSYENGAYSAGSNSNAGIALMWLKADGTMAGWNNSTGIHDTTDWAPLEVAAQAPAGAVQARAVLFTVGANNQGISGSVWFDDVSLKGESAMAVNSISPSSGTNTGTVAVTVAGTGFKQGASVRLEQGTTVVSATDVVVGSGASLTCKLDINGKATGNYDVVVKNPDGQEARLTGGFTVSAGCGQGTGASISVLAATLGILSLAGLGFRRRRSG